MTASTLFSSAPILPHHHHHHHHHHHPLSTQSFPSTKSWQMKSPYIILRASSSTPTVDKQEDSEQNKSSSSQPINPIPIGGCQACGQAEMERGCNGEGRIQGGIATVPGFGWWPIKAYRPCPGFVATGGRYRRQGQSMDEVAGFGTVPRKPATTTPTPTPAGTETRSSEKKEGPRKFKR